MNLRGCILGLTVIFSPLVNSPFTIKEEGCKIDGSNGDYFKLIMSCKSHFDFIMIDEGCI